MYSFWTLFSESVHTTTSGTVLRYFKRNAVETLYWPTFYSIAQMLYGEWYFWKTGLTERGGLQGGCTPTWTYTKQLFTFPLSGLCLCRVGHKSPRVLLGNKLSPKKKTRWKFHSWNESQFTITTLQLPLVREQMSRLCSMYKIFSSRVWQEPERKWGTDEPGEGKIKTYKPFLR